MFSASDDFYDGGACPHSDGNVIHGGRTRTGTGTSKVYKHDVFDESKCTPREGGSVRKQGLPSCRRWSETREISQHRKFESYWSFILATPLAGFISPDRDMCFCLILLYEPFQIILFLIFKPIYYCTISISFF